jgi:transketolase
MRKGFMTELIRLGMEDERVWLLIGDTGFGHVEKFQEACPRRYLNVGIAEQSIAGLAAGLALSGKIVFYNAIANFGTHRCLEQIRNDICYHHANVKLIVSGGGLAYGSLGMSHHLIEDLAVMRGLQDIIVMAPGDPVEARLATQAAYEHDGPIYIRLGRSGEPVIHRDDVPFQIGKAIRVRDGDALTLVSTGGMLESAVNVAERLEHEGTRVRVVSMHTLRPIDASEIASAAAETGGIVTIEEHVLTGGLGSAVAEVVADTGLNTRLTRIGLPPGFVRGAGSHAYMKQCAGLDDDSILTVVKKVLG